MSKKTMRPVRQGLSLNTKWRHCRCEIKQRLSKFYDRVLADLMDDLNHYAEIGFKMNDSVS